MLALAVFVAGLATGCAEPLTGPTLVLTLASPDKPGDINGPHVQHFAEEVSRLSEGAIRIEPKWDVAPDGAHGWDQTVARDVAAGEYDLALIPGRAWDELGVTSLRALDTPFLVTNLELLQAILDSGLRTDLLAGLPEAGVVGLDLFPSELRHPFGFRQPMLDAADYRGEVVRAPTSATTRMFLEELGATVVDDPADPRVQRGAESSYGPTLAGIATGNVTFFPKTESLVVNADVRDRLRDDQWEILQRAAAQTRGWLFATLPTDADSAADFCERGGRIVDADTDEVASFRAAGDRVRKVLEEDPATRELIESIQAMMPSYPGADGEPRCPESAPAQTGTSALDGIYVADVTKRALRQAGVTDPNRIRENAAHYVWTLDGGTWHYEATADHYIQTTSETGRYTYEDGLFTFYWNDGGHVEARLKIDRDGTVHFKDPLDSSPALQAETEGFFSAPWRHVSDLPG